MTVLLLLLGFILGNVPASWVFTKHHLFDLYEASRFLGFERLFLLEMLPFFGVLFVFLIAARWIHKVPFMDWISQRQVPSINRALFSFLFWGIFLVMSVGIQGVLNPDALHWNYQPARFFTSLGWLICLLPFQVLAEELLFRSYILQGLTARLKNPWIAVIISGVMFGAMHLGNPEVMESGYALLGVYALLGIFLALITCLDGGIELAFGFHFANNFFSGILLTSKDQALQLPALYSSDSGSFDAFSLILLVLGIAAFFLIALRRYKWRLSMLHQNIP